MKHQIDAEIRIEEYENGFGQVRYSPVLPDGQRPYLGHDCTYWSSCNELHDHIDMWSRRRSALRAGRRQWTRTLASAWTPVQV